MALNATLRSVTKVNTNCCFKRAIEFLVCLGLGYYGRRWEYLTVPLLRWQMTVSDRHIRIFKVIRLPPLTFVFAKQNLRAQLHSEVVGLRITHGVRKFRQFCRIQLCQCNEWKLINFLHLTSDIERWVSFFIYVMSY